MSRFFKSAAFPILIVVLLAFLAVKLVNPGSTNHRKHSYQTLVSVELPRGEVSAVQFKNKGKALEVKYRNKETAEFGFIDQAAPELIRELRSAGVQYNVESEKSSAILSLLTYILPFVIFLGFWIFLMNQVQGGGSKVMSFGKSRAKRLSADSPKITFRDVAGVDEAVEELHEIKEFLENPKKFQALGARIPTGVLLYGPPGTGKTLLARAVAGEAGGPFFSISRPALLRMFGGGGASRVRDLFEQAKQNSPCIIFMDEIDAVGRHPGAGLANLVNEAALLAARTNKREITQHELEEGIMRVIAGPEKKTRVMGEKERMVTAYHEMGHAMVAHFLEHTDPVHKISIISRGQGLCYSISLPTADKLLTT